jgi:hypothetical protein
VLGEGLEILEQQVDLVVEAVRLLEDPGIPLY